MSESLTPSHSPEPDEPFAGPYAAWRSLPFRLFAVGWFLMVFAKQIETVAVGIHLYARTRDPLALGWLGLVQAAPIVLLAIVGGQMADRFDRRRVLVCTLGLTTLVALGMLVVTTTRMSVGWIYVLLGLGAIGQALGSPARAALLPQLVPAVVFSNAVTWGSSIFQVATMIGPAVGGLIVASRYGSGAAFALVAACRVLSLLAIAAVPCAAVRRVADAVTLESLLAGLRFVWRTKLLLATIALDMFAVLLGGAAYLLPIFAEDILRVGPIGLGFLRRPRRLAR